MNEPPLIEIRERGRRTRRLVLSGPIAVGGDCAGENLADYEVSRQHLRLVPSPTALSVVDLGSRIGTMVNGIALTGRAALVRGYVVRLTPEPADGEGAKPTRYDRSIVSVVVIGNGIAGVTAADFIRRGHPDCEIHIVGRESHVL
jgi:hypothetical protein